MSTTRTHRGGRHKAVRSRVSGRRRAAVVAAGTAAAVLAGGGAAFAYWTTTGTGAGAAAASTMTAPTIDAGTVTGELYPGATDGTLAVTASNPNPFPITVTLHPSTSATGCTTPAISFSGGSFTLAANASSVTKLVSDSVSMGSSASNDCQGQALTVALTTTSQSN
jgi:hypothetical protein